MAKPSRAALFLAALLALSPLLLAAGVPGRETPPEMANGWLAGVEHDQPTGGEAQLFTLLRAEEWQPNDTTVQQYIRETLVALEDGGATGQPLAQSAMQALALSTAGIEIDNVVPSLLLALCNADGLAAEGYTAQLPALVLFGNLGVEVPGGVLFSPTGLARSVAANQNADGGFGEQTSDARTTAMVMCALSGFMETSEISSCLIEAQLWLQNNVNQYGGFNDNAGVEDPWATAWAMLALDGMGYNPELLSYNTGSLYGYLVTFQNPDGSFAPAGSDAQDYELSILCTAALAARQRFVDGRSAFLSMEDVVPLDPANLMPQTVTAPQVEKDGWRAALVVTGFVFVVALVLFISIRIRRRAR